MHNMHNMQINMHNMHKICKTKCKKLQKNRKNYTKICREPNQYAAHLICKNMQKYMPKICKNSTLCKSWHQMCKICTGESGGLCWWVCHAAWTAPQRPARFPTVTPWMAPQRPRARGRRRLSHHDGHPGPARSRVRVGMTLSQPERGLGSGCTSANCTIKCTILKSWNENTRNIVEIWWNPINNHVIV